MGKDSLPDHSADVAPSANPSVALPAKAKAGKPSKTSTKTPTEKRAAKILSVSKKLWKHDGELIAEFPILCGVDEVGRGPLAGNVVAACVILDLGKPYIKGL